MQRIGPCLWFDGCAEAAAEFYVSVFEDSKILGKTHYLEGMPGSAGSVMTVRFVLDGEEFEAINGGPQFHFTPAISFIVNCRTQDEIDELWGKLTDGGHEVQCGWLTDRFGVSWQIVPVVLYAMLNSVDVAAAQRASSAMLEMVQLDIAGLQRAFEGGA